MTTQSDKFVNSIEELIQDLTGADIRFNNSDRRKIKNKFKQLDESRKEWYKQDYKSLTKASKKELYLNFINKLSRVAFNMPNSTNPALDLAEYYISGILSIEKQHKFVKETNYSKYKDAVFNLIEEIYSQQKYVDVKEFSRTIPVEDVFSTSQFAFDLSSIPDLLERKFEATRGPKIKEYVNAYSDLGAFMEKAIRILIAIEKILKGENAVYSDINKFNTRNSVEHLKTKRAFNSLVSSFNITVFNASKHPVGGKRFRPSVKKVDFTDNKDTVSWSYETLVRQTRDLYVLVYLLSHFEDFLNVHIIKKLPI